MRQVGVEVLQQKRLPVWDEELWQNTDKVVYGPIASRRLGESLGINLFPKNKLCSFNCCYCYVGLTPRNSFQKEFMEGNILPSNEMKNLIKKSIEYHLHKGTPIDYVTICGNGEATNYPYFIEIAEFLLLLKRKLFPRIPLAVLTNSATVHSKEIVDVVNKYDENFFKLDVGDEKTFRGINRALPGVISFQKIVDGLKQVVNLKIQSAVVDSPKLSNLSSLKGPFIEVVKELDPLAIHIHNIDYPVPDESIRRLSLEEMVRLGEHIADRSGIPVKVLHSRISLRQKPKNMPNC